MMVASVAFADRLLGKKSRCSSKGIDSSGHIDFAEANKNKGCRTAR